MSPQTCGEIRILAVTTSAGFVPGLPGAGSPATIFCTGLNIGAAGTDSGPALPVQIQGITVRFADSFQAPIYGVADLGSYQIVNFQMPWESHLSPISLSQDGQSAALPSGLASWGEFFTTADGLAIAMHASSFSLISPSDPEKPGEWIVLYGSNFGPVLGAPATGLPAPIDRLVPVDPGTPVPWQFQIWLRDPLGDRLLNSNFIGLAPALIGAYQINVQLPDSLPPGGVQIYVTRTRDCGFFFLQGCGRGIIHDVSTIALLR